MRSIRFSLATFSILWVSLSCSQADAGEPSDVVARLAEGNQRFVEGRLRRVQDSASRRADLAKGQHPFAVIVGCADSRVAPEIVFDQALGDLFVVRVAGQVLSDPDIASIEYAVEHLGARTVVVLGHERCGAVKAVVDGGELHGHLSSFVPSIAPSVARARGEGGDVLDRAVRANVERVVAELARCEPILAENAYFGHVRFVGAHYDLDTGAVEFFGGARAAHDAATTGPGASGAEHGDEKSR